MCERAFLLCHSFFALAVSEVTQAAFTCRGMLVGPRPQDPRMERSRHCFTIDFNDRRQSSRSARTDVQTASCIEKSSLRWCHRSTLQSDARLCSSTREISPVLSGTSILASCRSQLDGQCKDLTCIGHLLTKGAHCERLVEKNRSSIGFHPKEALARKRRLEGKGNVDEGWYE